MKCRDAQGAFWMHAEWEQNCWHPLIYTHINRYTFIFNPKPEPKIVCWHYGLTWWWSDDVIYSEVTKIQDLTILIRRKHCITIMFYLISLNYSLSRIQHVLFSLQKYLNRFSSNCAAVACLPQAHVLVFLCCTSPFSRSLSLWSALLYLS